jgi:hypothetical protein
LLHFLNGEPKKAGRIDLRSLITLEFHSSQFLQTDTKQVVEFVKNRKIDLQRRGTFLKFIFTNFDELDSAFVSLRIVDKLTID